MTLGMFESAGDVGDTAHPGSVTYDPATGTYSITGGGANMWGTEDAFHYAWTRMSGDVFAAATIEFEGEGGDPHRKAGLIIRESLAPGARYADAVLHGDGLVSLQYRDVQDGETREIVTLAEGAKRIRLEKEGNHMYLSYAGEDGIWKSGGGNVRMPFEDGFLVGLGVSAHDNTTTETARFSDVSIEEVSMAPVTETGYPAGVDSTLEILDIASGNRQAIHVSDAKFEAPNWSRDGAFLLFNGGGKIWRISPDGGEPEEVNTGPQQKNNNDHGISPDGTQLIISDQSEPDDYSRIYVLPIEGSDAPQLVVGHPDGRSYWHAWHPEGDIIAYTAQRPAVAPGYNIWAKRLSGGEEWRVTDAEVLDDGADFTPDGEWLYFNSTRTGAMQIWRTRIDGSEVEQVTFDESYRDWFAHPSPDGKWIIMVSFGLDVDLTDHPPNREVVLRLMPADLSAPPRVIATLFGGQGTINVPSWSPDSSKVAFVSYRLDRPDRP
ncbi:MAG: TolB family protein [Hyphomonas sp.]|nr:TolB family protein [Hyphomonas sp.]